MKIIIVSKNSRIPVLKYGGTQRDIWAEGKILRQLGHQVEFLVRKGSYCPFARIIQFDGSKSLAEQIPGDADFVHLHHQTGGLIPKPYMVTIHGNGKPGEIFDLNTVFISKDHARRHGSERFVYNGLDFDQLGKPNLEQPKDGLLYLAKTNRRVKNLKGSIEIARKAGKKLHVAGGWRPAVRSGVKYYGMVGGEKKNRIIRGSEALLFPVLWHEPLGLAVLESMYFGLPVFATPYGSLPELVSGERGFLSNSKSELVWALRNYKDFDRKECHEFIADQFSAERMTKNYLNLFEEVMNGNFLNPENPRTLPGDKPVPFIMED